MAQRAVGLGEKGWFHQYDRQLRQESLWRMTESDVLKWLARIRCPVKLTVFSADRWPDYAKVWQTRLNSVPDIQVEQQTGSHHLHLEQPITVAKWLKQYLM
jgi:pimeloyl-ACP methyl ester carboxylesterase